MELESVYQESKGGSPQVAKVSYTHDAMIDMLVANPWISQNELAKKFGYTVPWISIVINSDAFKARLAARRLELVDPTIAASMDERFRAVVQQSLEVLSEKLAQPASQVPDNLALRAAELGAKALGLGGNAPPKAQPLSADHLQLLAGRLIQLQNQVRQQSSGQTLEGEFRETIKAISDDE